MKLYEISEQIRALMADAEETGEIDHDALSALEIGFADKVESTCAVIREYEAEAAALKDEIDRLNDRARAAKNKADGLREYVRHQMEATGEAKIRCKLFTVTLGKPSQVVTVINSDQLPVEMKRVTVSADKTAIGKALKSGTDVPGAALTEGKAKLIIK